MQSNKKKSTKNQNTQTPAFVFSTTSPDINSMGLSQIVSPSSLIEQNMSLLQANYDKEQHILVLQKELFELQSHALTLDRNLQLAKCLARNEVPQELKAQIKEYTRIKKCINQIMLKDPTKLFATFPELVPLTSGTLSIGSEVETKFVPLRSRTQSLGSEFDTKSLPSLPVTDDKIETDELLLNLGNFDEFISDNRPKTPEANVKRLRCELI